MQCDSCCIAGVFLLWECFPVLHLFFSAFRTACLQLLRSPSLSLQDGRIGKILFFFFLLSFFFLSFFFGHVVCFENLSTLTAASRLQATGDRASNLVPFSRTWCQPCLGCAMEALGCGLR